MQYRLKLYEIFQQEHWTYRNATGHQLTKDANYNRLVGLTDKMLTEMHKLFEKVLSDDCRFYVQYKG